jgi:glucokinase
MIIGVDLGGTKVRAGVARAGRIVNQKQQMVSKGSQEETLGQLVDMIRSLMVPGVEGIGLGVPSVVDPEQGIVYDVVNIPSWKRVPLKNILEEAFSVQVEVNNDSNCFALGEHRFGTLRNFSNAVGMTSGTGLGTGVIIDGKLYSGTNCGAGELGLLSYKEHNIEYYASGNFFDVFYHVSAVVAHERADTGDKQALGWWDEFGNHIGQAVKSALYAYDPKAIVIGGSLSKAFSLFEASMRRSLADFAYPESIKKLKIFQSTDENITLLGAAALVHSQNTHR